MSTAHSPNGSPQGREDCSLVGRAATLIVVAVLAVGGAVVAAAPLAAAPPSAMSVPSTLPPAPPTGLGTDAMYDALANLCFAGDMAACDSLYSRSDVGSAYETYGDTCAGRKPAGTGEYCLDTFGPGTPVIVSGIPVTESTAAPVADAQPQARLVDLCVQGAVASCDMLYRISDAGSPVEEFGDTCGSRRPAGTGEWCTDVFPASAEDIAATLTAAPIGIDSAAGPSTVPAPTVGEPTPPEGLGEDAAMNGLADACFAGDLAACDSLYWQSEAGSAYEVYGDTCGGRAPEGAVVCAQLDPGA